MSCPVPEPLFPPSAAGREERRRRRLLLREHHPDLGGDPEKFIAVVRSGGSDQPTTSARAGAEVRFVRTPSGLGRIPAWYRKQQRKHQRRRRPRVL